MDSDMRISRLSAAKRHLSLQQRHLISQSDRANVNEYEVEEESRQEFACPYCYEEHDIASLCCHLEDEHPFDSRVAVCPICSAKVARDMLNHIMLQHGELFKLQRHRRLRRVAIPGNQGLALLGRDLREAHLQVLFGNRAQRSGNSHVPVAAPDSLLSSLVLNLPSSEQEETSKLMVPAMDDAPKRSLPSRVWKSSIDSSLSQEEKERKMRQAAVRAVFVQNLLRSTLFSD